MGHIFIIILHREDNTLGLDVNVSWKEMTSREDKQPHLYLFHARSILFAILEVLIIRAISLVKKRFFLESALSAQDSICFIGDTWKLFKNQQIWNHYKVLKMVIFVALVLGKWRIINCNLSKREEIWSWRDIMCGRSKTRKKVLNRPAQTGKWFCQVLVVLIKEYPTYTTQGKTFTTHQTHLNKWILLVLVRCRLFIILWEGSWDACWI